MIVLSDMVKDIVLGDEYSDREKVNLLRKLMEPELEVDAYTERLARLCVVDVERARERAERRREQNRRAQQRYRERAVETASEPAGGVSVRKQASAGVSKSKQCKRLTDTDTDPNQISVSEIHRPDSDARARAEGAQGGGGTAPGGAGTTPGGAGESGLRGGGTAIRGGGGKPAVDPWTMDNDELFSGAHPTVSLLRAAFGRGCWRRAVDQLGEAEVLGEFAAFRAEIEAGEAVANRAAAFTARLVKNGYVPDSRR